MKKGSGHGAISEFNFQSLINWKRSQGLLSNKVDKVYEAKQQMSPISFFQFDDFQRFVKVDKYVFWVIIIFVLCQVQVSSDCFETNQKELRHQTGMSFVKISFFTVLITSFWAWKFKWSSTYANKLKKVVSSFLKTCTPVIDKHLTYK